MLIILHLNFYINIVNAIAGEAPILRGCEQTNVRVLLQLRSV